MKRVLFILKQRGVPYHVTSLINTEWASYNWTGLGNSVRYVSDMLNQQGFISRWVAVADNNKIDKEVYDFRPDFCIIEALWVVPEKFQVLTKLHPKVRWNIRLHSEIPFISQEGIAMDWVFKYYDYKNVMVSSNSVRMQQSLSELLNRNIPYTPNYYPLPPIGNYTICPEESDFINIGCYGAIRPLKNQLAQAVAALQFAESIDKTLIFHINGVRLEMGGEPIFRNIVALFSHSYPHQLKIDGWVNTAEFIKIVKTMDMGMQVSFSETFNIVSADFVSSDIPIVISPEVTWCNKAFKANPTNINEIVDKLRVAWFARISGIQSLNKDGLLKYDFNSVKSWTEYLSS